MAEQKYEEVISIYISKVKEFVDEQSDIVPHIIIVGDDLEEDDTVCLSHIPIPSEFMGKEGLKQKFVKELLPAAFRTVKEKMTCECAMFVTSSYMTMIDTKTGKSDKKEAIFISKDYGTSYKLEVYEVIKIGQQVTKNGDIVDKVELKEMDMSFANDGDGEVGGVFVRLFEKFQEA